MKISSPYRSLPAEKRVALLLHAMSTRKASRAIYAQRLVARGGGYRAATLIAWPPERLAREIVRRNAENAHDELELLQLLYLEIDPQLQIEFLNAAGVPHTDGVIADELPVPYAEAPAVIRAAELLVATRGTDAINYIQTIARYNGEAWPGIDDVVANYLPSEDESGDL